MFASISRSESTIFLMHRSSGRLRGLVGHRRLATSRPSEKRVYVVAGEASGDAVGAKVISALQRKAAIANPHLQLVFRGIGGTQMTSSGAFTSLFPMEELSVMGLVEVLPSIPRLRRRFVETVDDIRAFQPHVLLTIDAKGFTFRVQRAIANDGSLRNAVVRMHYVAPSVWAYRHRQRKTNFSDLQMLLDKLFVILPFEKQIFMDKTVATNDWCEYVGHPAMEDFLEFHHAYDSGLRTTEGEKECASIANTSLEISDGGLLRGVPTDTQALVQRGRLLERLMRRGRDVATVREAFRVERGLSSNAFVVCALVGSRENEVRRTIRTVLQAIDAMQRPTEQVVQTTLGIPMKLTPLSSSTGCVVRRPIHVVFPTIKAVEAIVRHEIENFCRVSGASHEHFEVLVDANSSKRFEFFQSADAAVAVSGTIVMETTLAALPTVVIYRANRITEFLAKQLSAVKFVSIPNLLVGRAEIPELLFRDCTAVNISIALRSIYNKPAALVASQAPSQMAMALSTLIPWQEKLFKDRKIDVPQRGSDLVAQSIWRALFKS